MYRCYNLIVKNNLSKEKFKPNKKFDIPKAEFLEDIESFIMGNETLDAQKIKDNWFPEINADIFISHSHADLGYVSKLTDKLKHLGLRTFVDSEVWGYSDTLLKNLDNKYCYDKETNTYNYNTRNKTTSCIHLILLNALAQMIDKCECIIFVNTQNSIMPSSYIKQEEETYSPWLYNEIALSRLIRVRTKEEHRTQVIAEDSKSQIEQRLFKAKYKTSLSHMTEITEKEFSDWHKKISENSNIKRHQALDLLYAAFPEK